MVLTKQIIEDMCKNKFQTIDSMLEDLLLRRLGTEPYPHVYTEQDLAEQSRKIIQEYHAVRKAKL